ncbi:type II secretion system protein [Propionivibrio sp.]|uniref:type II secretion system protein n=1 Tax=Propionivibrio sp. TaxID=2212460 RepID=UPI003BF262E5
MKSSGGFTLVEIAIVLVIVGLLVGGVLMPLSTQVEQKRIAETEKYLEQIKEALLGFAAANGRLPCPATAASNGMESPPGGGVCTNSYNGFLPAVTLGLSPVDSAGFATDAWNVVQNRIRYAVTTSNSSAFTTTGLIKSTGLGTLSSDLYVCASATGITATTCGTATSLATNAVAVIYSLGKNAPAGGTGLDEAANLNYDKVFVSHTEATTAAANGEFDDIVTWLSPNILFNRMVTAGQLP